MAEKNYLVCYDIADKKRLRKVRKVVYAYALGGQKSALECPLDAASLRELTEKLQKLIRENDKVNIIAFSDEPICFGRADFIAYERGVIIV